VWLLCRQQRLGSTTTKKGRYAQRQDTRAAVYDDLVQRYFTAPCPDALWLIDITEHPNAEGKLYCCAIKDVFPNGMTARTGRTPSVEASLQWPACPQSQRCPIGVRRGEQRPVWAERPE
jgi:transposase InsO family protein